MSRIFTFGCSFTQYGWPTWADIIAYDQEAEYCNYALAGLGNVAIFHRMLEADLIHNFRDDDKIFVLWTSWSREDRVKHSNWLPSGSVLNPNNEHYNKKFMKNYWDFDNDIVKNSTAIISANRLYNISWQATAFEFFTDEEGFVEEPNAHIVNMYKDSLPAMQRIKCETHIPFKQVRDSHPDILGHMGIAEIVCNAQNITLRNSTVDTFNSLQKDIETLANSDQHVETLIPKIERLLRSDYSRIANTVNYRSIGE